MKKEDLIILKETISKAKGIELIDKEDLIVCLVHFDNEEFYQKFYYLLYNYEFDFIVSKKIDLNYKISIHFKDTDSVFVSDSERNTMNYKPLNKLLNDGLDLFITTGIKLTGGDYLELPKHIKVDNLILTHNKSLLN